MNLAVCDSDCLTDGFTDIADKPKRIKKNHIHPTGGVTSSNVRWKTDFFNGLNQYELEISFVTVVHKVNGKVTGLFSSWSHASWWNERSASAPWSRRRPKRASTFSLVKRFFFLREKEMVQTPYYVIIKFFIWGHIQSI